MHYVMRHKTLIIEPMRHSLIAGIHIAQPLILKYAIDHVF